MSVFDNPQPMYHRPVNDPRNFASKEPSMSESQKQVIELLNGIADTDWVLYTWVRRNAKQALALLESEPINDGTGGPFYIKKLESDIDELKREKLHQQAENEKLKYELKVITIAYEGCYNHGQAEELRKQDKQIEQLQAELAKAKEEVEQYKPKPLFFNTLLGFRIIINEEVPKNQIWFATQEQLSEALEYSQKQLEQALKGE